MTNTMQNPIDCANNGPTGLAPYSFKCEGEMGKLEHEAGHEYVPMDVYIDTGTRKKHFEDALDPRRSQKYIPMDVYIDSEPRNGNSTPKTRQ